MTLAEQLLRDGVPPSLLIDLLDPEGMRAALAAEVVTGDVEAVRVERVRSLLSA